jgi:hypothetical protein
MLECLVNGCLDHIRLARTPRLIHIPCHRWKSFYRGQNTVLKQFLMILRAFERWQADPASFFWAKSHKGSHFRGTLHVVLDIRRFHVGPGKYLSFVLNSGNHWLGSRFFQERQLMRALACLLEDSLLKVFMACKRRRFREVRRLLGGFQSLDAF